MKTFHCKRVFKNNIIIIIILLYSFLFYSEILQN